MTTITNNQIPQNGFIKDVIIGFSDRGFLDVSISINFKYEAVYGGFALCGTPNSNWMQGQERSPSAYCGAVLQRLLLTFEKQNIEQLKGIPCRVAVEDGLVVGIGHYMKDKWFSHRIISTEFLAFCDSCKKEEKDSV